MGTKEEMGRNEGRKKKRRKKWEGKTKEEMGTKLCKKKRRKKWELNYVILNNRKSNMIVFISMFPVNNFI